jgi:hypothetical protein
VSNTRRADLQNQDMNKLNDNNDHDNDAIAEDDDMDILWNVQADIQTAADLTTAGGAVAPRATKIVDIVCEDAIVASFVVAIQSHDDVETTATLAAVSEPCLATWQPVPLQPPPPSPPLPLPVPPLPAN